MKSLVLSLCGLLTAKVRIWAAASATTLACTGALFAGEIGPVDFKDLAFRSVNILETYNTYRHAFEEKRSKQFDSASGELSNRKNTFLLFVDLNPMLPDLGGEHFLNGGELKTNEGLIQATMQKTYGAANLSYFFQEYEAGVYIIADLLQLHVMEMDNPGKEHLFKGLASDEALDFSAGYMVVSAFLNRGNQGLDLGLLLRHQPITEFDTLTRQESFRFARQSDGSYEGTRIRPEIFARYHDHRYDVNSLFSLRNGLEWVGLGLTHPVPYGFEVEPFLRYFHYKTRFQLGATIQGTLFDRLDSEIEFANDLHRNSAGRFEYFHHLILRNKLVFFRMRHEDLPKYSRYDFFMSLNGSYSISSDILEERVTGWSGGLALENIFGFLSLFLGGGYNEYKYLSIFPFKNSFTTDIKAQIAW